jgi:hypothetical protein
MMRPGFAGVGFAGYRARSAAAFLRDAPREQPISA